MGRFSLWLVLAGCSYQAPTGALTSDGTPSGDGPAGDGPQVNEDGVVCTAGFFDVCSQAPPTEALTMASGQIDTDNDPRCRTVTQSSGPAVCLIAATSVSMTGTVTVFGARALAISSATTISITGELDISSRRGGRIGPGADDTTCDFALAPQIDGGGAGGAAGGSAGQQGAAGGVGDSDNSIGFDGNGANGLPGAVIGALTVLRAGCGGDKGGNQAAGGNQGGDGGHGGGAVYLVAKQSIEIANLRATGAGGGGGGAQAGGGGGGSGGVVVLEAPAIQIGGAISANAGGGGEGGAIVGTTPVSGQPGSDGDYGTVAALGGAGNDTRFGFGGAGGVDATAPVIGTTSIVGGGGGGGGVGIVRLIGTRSGAGQITPAPL